MTSNKNLSRLAGFCFLILILCGVFAEFFVRQKIVVEGDTALTGNNIIAFDSLFRLGIASDLVMIIAFFFFGQLMHHLLQKENKGLAKLMSLCIVVSVSIMSFNMLNQVAALLLMSGDLYLKSFSIVQLQTIATFFLKMHTNGYVIAKIFFGLYLFPLGYIIYNKDLIPKILGGLLMLGCLGDLIEVFTFFLFPHVDSILLQNLTVPADLGELLLCFWLLFGGLREQKTDFKDVLETGLRAKIQTKNMSEPVSKNLIIN